jgi:hypothetical protein
VCTCFLHKKYFIGQQLFEYLPIYSHFVFFRTSFKHIPKLNGVEIDLFLLYWLVTAQGGWEKVRFASRVLVAVTSVLVALTFVPKWPLVGVLKQSFMPSCCLFLYNLYVVWYKSVYTGFIICVCT